MESFIRLENASKRFKIGDSTNLVLSNINFTICPNQKISIIGQSGVGKSTLLNLIGLTTPPTTGKIFVDGKNTQELKGKDLAALRNKYFGYITQDFALIEDETVFDNVSIPLLYNKALHGGKNERLQRVQAVLEKVSIPEKIHDKAKTLSGGQRQRVAIARALVNDPAVLLCDEPTGSLDVDTGKEIFNLLETISEQNHKTLILVTHNLELAARCSLRFQVCNRSLLPLL